MHHFSRRRFWTLSFLIGSFFFIVIYQLFQLSVVHRPALVDVAGKQHRLSSDTPPLRGSILDRNGKEFAANLLVPSVYAVPRLLGKKEKLLLSQKIAPILGLDEKFVAGRLNRDKSFVWLKRRTTHDITEKIRQLKQQALGIIAEPRRFYPQGDLLAQILGFTNVDTTGIEGIELHLNQELQGSFGKRYTRRDALGREIRAFEIKSIPAVDGNHVHLTIDQHIQYLTERALERAFTQWKAKGAAAIVMNAKTGEILALVNRPTFNPNESRSSDPENRRNRAITDMYEPGSVFKIVTASALFNEGKVQPETIFFCENGHYHYGSRTLHDVHSYGSLTFEEVIVKSSNIGTVKASLLLEPHVFQSYVEGFGFGKSTGIDLPGEAPGFTRPPSQWSKTSPYNIPIGHEVMVTAIQVTAAMAVIANGGNLMKPYIISKITDKDGVVIKENQPLVKRRVIREEIAFLMRNILKQAVDEGTGKSAKIEGISVGGKTGTAQKVLPNGGGYSHSNFISSFVGFAPVEEPQLVMTVMVDDPRGKYYGGTVAAPVFKEVIEAALLYLGYIPENAKVLESPMVETKQSLPANPPRIFPTSKIN